MSDNMTDSIREGLATGKLKRQCSEDGETWIDCPRFFADTERDCCSPYKRFVGAERSGCGHGTCSACTGAEWCCFCVTESTKRALADRVEKMAEGLKEVVALTADEAADEPEMSPEVWRRYHDEPKPLGPYAARLVPQRHTPPEQG